MATSESNSVDIHVDVKNLDTLKSLLAQIRVGFKQIGLPGQDRSVLKNEKIPWLPKQSIVDILTKTKASTVTLITRTGESLAFEKREEKVDFFRALAHPVVAVKLLLSSSKKGEKKVA